MSGCVCPGIRFVSDGSCSDQSGSHYTEPCMFRHTQPAEYGSDALRPGGGSTSHVCHGMQNVRETHRPEPLIGFHSPPLVTLLAILLFVTDTR